MINELTKVHVIQRNPNGPDIQTVGADIGGDTNPNRAERIRTMSTRHLKAHGNEGDKTTKGVASPESEKIVHGMVKHLKSGGTLPPPLVDHKGVVLDGHHRVEAHHRAGIPTMKVRQLPNVLIKRTVNSEGLKEFNKMIKENIKDLILAIAEGDSVGVDTNFNAVISAKIADRLDDLRVDVAGSMFGSSVVEESYELDDVTGNVTRKKEYTGSADKANRKNTDKPSNTSPASASGTKSACLAKEEVELDEQTDEYQSPKVREKITNLIRQGYTFSDAKRKAKELVHEETESLDEVKGVAPGDWHVMDDKDGRIHSTHPTQRKALNAMDRLNTADYDQNKDDPARTRHNIFHNRYYAVAKSHHDEKTQQLNAARASSVHLAKESVDENDSGASIAGAILAQLRKEGYDPKHPKIDLHNKTTGGYITSTNWSPTVKHAVSTYEDKYPHMKGNVNGVIDKKR